MDNTRVLLVDDQVLFIESLERVINNRAKGIEIVGIAYNGKEAVELTEKLKPDVILMDIRMPKINGCTSFQDNSRKVSTHQSCIADEF